MLLHLWAASVERASWVSDELTREHLAWTRAPLQEMGPRRWLLRERGLRRGGARALVALDDRGFGGVMAQPQDGRPGSSCPKLEAPVHQSMRARGVILRGLRGSEGPVLAILGTLAPLAVGWIGFGST